MKVVISEVPFSWRHSNSKQCAPMTPKAEAVTGSGHCLDSLSLMSYCIYGGQRCTTHKIMVLLDSNWTGPMVHRSRQFNNDSLQTHLLLLTHCA